MHSILPLARNATVYSILGLTAVNSPLAQAQCGGSGPEYADDTTHRALTQGKAGQFLLSLVALGGRMCSTASSPTPAPCSLPLTTPI